MDAILPPLPREREFKENRPRGNLKTNRDFGDFKGFDPAPRSAPPKKRKNMRRLTTEDRNAFAPKAAFPRNSVSQLLRSSVLKD